MKGKMGLSIDGHPPLPWLRLPLNFAIATGRLEDRSNDVDGDAEGEDESADEEDNS